jgi:methyl-accepting chemotaxis protein
MSGRTWTASFKRTYSARLVFGVLLIGVPVMIVIVLVLTQSASSRLRDHAFTVLRNQASLVADEVKYYFQQRGEDLTVDAAAVSGIPAGPQLDAKLTQLWQLQPEFRSLLIVGADGKVMAGTTGAARPDNLAAQDWFRTAARGTTAVSRIAKQGDQIVLAVAQPVVDSSGRVTQVLVGNLNLAPLSKVLSDAQFADSSEVYLASADKHLILSSRTGPVDTEQQLVDDGALRTVTDSAGVRAALAGGAGTVEADDYEGRASLIGYAPIPTTGWAAIAKEDQAAALAGVAQQWWLGALLALGGAVLLTVGALIFARRESRYLRSLVGNVRDIAASVGGRAHDISSTSRELASTTSEQEAAVSETSATMEELARTAGEIAETVDRVATQLNEARDNLQQAEADIAASGDRTLALSGRVHEIGGILVLINEIADQTNLLALNAAIEAARAGDAGQGFTVVADEVRRLAERSKASAGEIATIVNAAEAENSSTVLAMEAGAKQVSRSLALIEAVSVGGEQVQLTTQQQRNATEQVVTAMAQLSEGSRQLAAATQQLAGAAESMTSFATDLDNTAETTAARL